MPQYDMADMLYELLGEQHGIVSQLKHGIVTAVADGIVQTANKMAVC